MGVYDQHILDTIGDETYPAGYIVEVLQKAGIVPYGYDLWSDMKHMARVDILDMRMGTVTYMVRKHRAAAHAPSAPD